MNPADLPSRGCSASYIIASKWWEGPEWLYLSPEEWSKEDFSADEKEIALEKKKKIVSTLINLNTSDLVLTRFSSYRKTIRLVAWICRFVYNCKHQNKKKDGLTVSEINEAENLLIRLIQCESFHGIEDKRIISLNPFIDHGIIRTKTAIFQRDDTSEFRTPAILPSDHPLVKSLVMEEHKLKGHIGVSHFLNSLRERFWILAGRRVVSSVLKTRITCKRYSSKNVNPPPPPLPGESTRCLSFSDNRHRLCWTCTSTRISDCMDLPIYLYSVPLCSFGTGYILNDRYISTSADGESRRVRLKVQNGEVIRAVQSLYPLELSSTEELPSKFNQNCRCENISPELTPFDNTPVKSDGTIPADIQLPTITKSGRS
ncbi:hypothetical protein AVEN_152158-1 [Araneus ventricosus]|uniref:Uncharacterized protein n=1 Tax=Araneus ventricosus TaxID=182803 RepID=A0A4Y2HKP4_ARAVE|nr:hypothetical protein AVEN_152158-1 [Araneus ventricosus]